MCKKYFNVVVLKKELIETNYGMFGKDEKIDRKSYQRPW